MAWNQKVQAVPLEFIEESINNYWKVRF